MGTTVENGEKWKDLGGRGDQVTDGLDVGLP